MRTIFDWLEFKDVGDELSLNAAESYVRGAITMYYYAIFSAIREYLVKIKKQYQFLNNKDIHRRVWEYLVSTNDYNENEVGEFLSNTRSVRNLANYDKEHDYDYFIDKLDEIRGDIENIVNSIIFLRDNPSLW